MSIKFISDKLKWTFLINFLCNKRYFVVSVIILVAVIFSGVVLYLRVFSYRGNSIEDIVNTQINFNQRNYERVWNDFNGRQDNLQEKLKKEYSNFFQ